MRFALAALCAGLLVFAAAARADELQDLFSGKAVAPAKPADTSWSETRPVHEPVVVPLDVLPLTEKAPWEGAAASPAEPTVAHGPSSRDDAPSARVNLVPEP